MARVPDYKRIRKEDFDADMQPTIEKLGYIINAFSEQVINLLNKNVDFQNLNQEVVNVDIMKDGSGALINPPSIKTSLNSKVQGILCIKADNMTSVGTYPTSQPFVSYNLINNNLISILNVSGLQNSSTYRLKLLLIG
jgi:hypothetical protein